MREGGQILSVMVLVILTVVACSGCSKPSTSLSPEAKANLEKEAPPSAGPPIDGPMPASLSETYQNAEQAFGAVSSMDWAAGATAVTALNHSLEQVRADLKNVTSANDVRAGVVSGKEDLIDSELNTLNDAIRAHDRESAKRAANRLTMPIAELAGRYASPVSGELMMLKYYSRQLDIAASTNDKPLLKETADNVRLTWSGLRPSVEAHGGVAEVRRFNDLIDDLEKSGPPGQLGAVLRDRIDEIEQVLKR